MSMDYTNRTHEFGIVDTPSDDDVLGYVWNKTHKFVLIGFQVLVITQGAQAASAIEFYNVTDTTQLYSLVIGTSAANTMLEGHVSEALAVVSPAKKIAIRVVTTDASIVYHWKAFWSAGLN